jgi:hypothetical protein
MTNEQRESYIKALLVERETYEKRDLEDRVAEVDAELARVGAEGKSPAKRATRRVTKPAEER